MKLGIGGFQEPLTGRVDFARAAALGYDCFNYDLADTGSALYSMDEDAFRTALADEKRRADDAGIECVQCHGPWPTKDLTEKDRAQKLVFMKRGVLGASILGCKYFVIHPVMPYGWGQEKESETPRALTKELLLQLSDYAKPLDVTICLENMPFLGHALSTVDAVAGLVEEIGRENVKICLDTGHANCYKVDIGDQVRRCGENLACLHIHDNNGMQDEHLFPYAGTINWPSFKTALREIGYTGCLTLETNVRKGTPEAAHEPLQQALYHLVKSLDYTAE